MSATDISTVKTWCKQSRAKTIVFDVMHVMLFYGERYMTRTVAECARRDPRVAEIAHAFVVQEMQHATAHKGYWPEIAASYDLSPLHRLFAALTALLNWLPLALRLAITLAIEHNTAVFAEVVLRGRLLAGADPAPRRLLEWHCAEELEHKHAVFYVLDSAIGSPSLRWAWRQLGMLCAVPILCFAEAAGFFLLRRQLPWRGLVTDARDLFGLFVSDEALVVRGLLHGIDYALPGHEPALDARTRALAEETLGRPLLFPTAAPLG